MSKGMHPDLKRWVAEVAPKLGLSPEEVPLQSILDLARDVAHGAVRPGAPVTAFMLGLAAGSGRVNDVAAVAKQIGKLANGWAEQKGGAA